MSFCQVWIARKAARSNLAKPQTFPLEKPRGSISGLRCSFIFWMSFNKDLNKNKKGKQYEITEIYLNFECS